MISLNMETKNIDKDREETPKELEGKLKEKDITENEKLNNFDQSQKLIDIANNTFRELCQTLEREQTKLSDLEVRRKKLQEEMLQLKQEIEAEKEMYHTSINYPVELNKEEGEKRKVTIIEEDGSDDDIDEGTDIGDETTETLKKEE